MIEYILVSLLEYAGYLVLGILLGYLTAEPLRDLLAWMKEGFSR